MDLIADMLTRVRNANQRYHKSVTVSSSKMVKAIAQVMVDQGFLLGAQERAQEGNKKVLELKLKYKGKRGRERVITGLERVSRLSCRAYAKADQMPDVLNGMGICIVSTPQGIFSGHEARKRRVGGEVLCKVW